MMVIDLTLSDDSDHEDHPGPIYQPKPEPKSHPSFFSDLAHRLNPLSTFTISGTVSGKRKRKSESESSDSPGLEVIKSASSSTSSRHLLHGGPHHKHLHNSNVFGARLPPATPSPSPGLPDRLSLPRVVVPSPSRHLSKEIASANWTQPLEDSNITGLSEEFYPTDAFDVRARKGAYPAARKVNRADVPFSVGRCGPILSKRPAVQDQLHISLKRKLDRLHGPKVSVAPQDEHALAVVTANFEFINSYKLQKGVAPADPGFDCGCTCGPICDPERCLCLDEEGDSDQEDEGGSPGSASQNNRTIVSYQRAPDSDEIVLTPEFMKRTARIAECGRLCGCDENCWNRVVQRGRTVRLEIFDTGNRGFGLRSPDAIRAGQFIDCYLGEVVTREQADVREELAIKHGHSYLFSLDFSPEATEDKMYVVDGQRYGSPTRFMNHSCNPNCRMFPVSHTHADHNLYDLAFFALRDIPPRTELTFDYSPGAKQAQAAIDPNAVRCLCMEKNCRGQLWPNQRKGSK